MRYLIAGGGTGGHIYPALAVCKGLLGADPAAEILYVGTRRGFEAELVPREGIRFEVIDAAGIMGKSPIAAAKGAARALLGTFQAAGILRRFRPHAALGTGGYVSGPVILVAALAGVPCAIQEQNAVPGATNRLLARFVREVFVPFEGTRAHFPKTARCVLTGNPIRPEIMQADREDGAQRLGLDPKKKTLFVFGGSRGARRIIEVALEMLAERMLPEDVQVLLTSGREYASWVSDRLSGLGIDVSRPGNVIFKPYLFQIEYAMAASDLLVGRAGGMTVSEVLARGLPSILVPSPNVANNHQLYNARAASRTGGAVLVREQDLTATRLAGLIRDLTGDRDALRQMSEKAKAAGRPFATGDIVEHLKALASRNPK